MSLSCCTVLGLPFLLLLFPLPSFSVGVLCSFFFFLISFSFSFLSVFFFGRKKEMLDGPHFESRGGLVWMDEWMEWVAVDKQYM